ncbi:helicase SRCAP isoform X2 [Takifugu flavidus]|uniref:helicase SRCAP isoform X2 n=1 Tax=Takifugu flavidus TaxID=433684 RepID=UPI002544B3D9|nr:helicase SRCAP isoform X2 [Takifugu flavidus]
MEKSSPVNLPETLPICSNTSQDSISEDVPAEESVRVPTSLPTSLNEDCSSSSEMQKLSSPHGHPVSAIQNDSTAEEMHYRSQTHNEKWHSDRETNQRSNKPSREGAGLLDVTGSEEKQADMLEYKTGTAPTIEPGKNEHKVEPVRHESHSQISVTASSLSVQQSSFDTTGPGIMGSSDRGENQTSQTGQPDAAEQTGIHQDSTSPVLASALPDKRTKQTDTSQPKTEEISNDAKDAQKTNSLESVEKFANNKELADTSGQEHQLPSSETLAVPAAGELLRGLYTSGSRESLSSSATGKDDGKVQGSSRLPGGEQMERSLGTEKPEMVIFCASTESSSKPSAAVPSFDTRVSLQTEEVVATDPSDQVLTTETPLTTELVHSSQEIVLVREDANISGGWSNVQLNQSYLLREDGTVCEAAIFSSELSTAEPKQYEESFPTDIELHSQSVEVYQFCSLVEEVAEETVCVSSAAHAPHSPGYEVNLFNALLENSEDYHEKEDLEPQRKPSLNTINEGDAVVISQHPVPLSHDATKVQPSSNSNSHNLSSKNTVEPHLVLGVNQDVEAANTSDVCFVEVATESPCSFTVEKPDAGPVPPCSEITLAGQTQTEGRSSPLFQTVLQKKDAEASGGILSLIPPVVTGEGLGMESSIAVSVHVSHVELQPSELTVLSATETDLTPSQSIENVALSREPKQESSQRSNILNPKLLLLKQGEPSLLKHPSSLLKKVTEQQNVAISLATAHKSWPGTVSKECLPQMASAADASRASAALTSQKDQKQRPFDTPADPSVKVQSTNLGSNISLVPDQSTSSSSKFEKEALTIPETSTPESDVASQDVIAADVTSASMPNKVYMVPISVEGGRIVMSSTSPTEPVNQSESLYMEEESEDMEQDELMDENETQDAEAGQVSSAEEASDEEPDKTDCEMTTPGLQYKVCQWITDRVTTNSPVSPSTSSPYLSSSSTDWSTPRRERSSPLRGPHGKFVSPSSLGGYSSSSSPPDQSYLQRPRGERHTDMAELAKHEADIEHRSQALKREGFWSTKRLTRLMEPPRPKVHWDYLCEEMQWLSADFAQERRWKRGVARKVVRMVMRHHEELRQKEEKAKRDEHAKIRRVASSIAKEVRAFWSSVEKVVQYKQQSRLEEKRKKALDLQLDFIVGQTEKYSDLLSKSLAPIKPPEIVPVTPKKSLPAGVDEDDRDFEPPCEEEDDEETIEVEEQQDGNDAESHQREIELLKEESLLPLDQLLSTLNLPQESGSEEECSEESSSSPEEDAEFSANEEDAEDEEDTIAAQEKVEGNVDHAEELDDLAKEGNMSVEELLEKYKGAYSSDFDIPSASGSKESSDLEVSGDEEEETEEDESDAASNTSSSDSSGDSAEEDDSEKDIEESEEEAESDDCGDEGTELLLKEGDNSPPSSSSRPKKEISHIAATAESLQPKGYTLATTKVKTPIPFLLHGTLREYQHIGLDWLVTMYEKKLNGILADEMGLGKTIQTIALLAHLACEKGNWGPHLIIVPTSVMLNWEMELKRWCPGFKILTYFGSQKERKLKRQGWTKPNAFHVCITSYKLVLQDHQAFRRKSWRYLILDEAQNIKNFKSQRWQSLLNFNSHRRLLLTGTPLQNSLMELWSLMHFLMPHVFQSHREFKEWFSNPLTGMIEGSQEYNEGLVKRLHKVLRPFLLRRIKVDVEKQMPKKYEHVVRCRLSKRQRFLYDDFMAQASTRETLASGHFMSVINILMQLRKVCNHPNLFDPRPIQSPFITQPIVFRTASLVQDALEVPPMKRCDLSIFDLIGLESRVSRYQADVFLPRHKVSRQLIQEIVESPEPPPRPKPVRMKVNRMLQPLPKGDNRPVLLMNKPTCSVPPAAQASKPAVTEVPSAPAPSPVVQQVVCTVATTSAPRPMHPAPQTAVRLSTPKPVLTVRAPTASSTASSTASNPAHPNPTPMPQRVLLSPDMQARLPSGEVVSIAQLASLAGRPVSSCQGSKPVTFQLQGNKLTLSGAQIHQVPAAAPRPVQSSVMHLVSAGSPHLNISQSAPVTAQNTAIATTVTSSTLSVNRVAYTAHTQATSSMISSPGIVKIVVRQTAGKDGGPVPTLAVAPSPRVAPQVSPSPNPYLNTTPVRNTAPIQIVQRTPGPATAHYTIAPPGKSNPTQSQSQPPRPILKVVQAPSNAEQSAQAQPTSSTSSATPQDKSSSEPPTTSKSKPCASAKANAAPRKMLRPPPRSPFYMSGLADSLKNQHDSRLDFIFGVNERRCGAKPVYGLEVLDFLTFLPGPCPEPAAQTSLGAWGRSGQSSCLYAQWPNKNNHWFQCTAVKEGIHSIEDRLEQLSDITDRFTFVIPPVEAPPISMHSCHPPPSLSHKEATFTSELTTEVAPLIRSLHHIHCSMRTQFPDLRLIEYDCGKLQTLHTLLRKLKIGGHRVLIFTQMTRMLDVLEQFLNYHGHIYLRLDGNTRVEQRQALMERFNADQRIFCFILSTRSGGVGVNLTGADTVIFYDSDWNPTMDAQAQDRCHRIGQTRDVHIYRLISERTVEENILKKANQKRMLGDMAIEGGNFTTAFFKQQTIRELFDMNDGEKKEMAVEVSVPQAEEEETVNKQSTTILEQALCRAEDEEDIVAASQAKAEQVAELAEFNENIPLDDGGEQEEVEELSKAEQEIAALVEQLTPIERYAMNFLEASLEDVCKEELKQAEEQVEAARKGLDQAKEEGLKLHASSDDDDNDFMSPPASAEPVHPTPARRGRKPKDKNKIVASTRMSGRLRGASPETEPEPTPPREVPDRLRLGLRGRGAAKDSSTVSTSPSCADQYKTPVSSRLQDSSRSSSTASSPANDHPVTKSKTLTNRSHTSPMPSPPLASISPTAGKYYSSGETDSKNSKLDREEDQRGSERRVSESSVESSCLVDNHTKDDDVKDHSAMSPPSTCSRSPRKRQSADNEVLRGLVEDSPSAKVLRKLPGRLVTVVEEKEPRKRRRRGSGTGGEASMEEAPVEDAAGSMEESNKGNVSLSAEGKSKDNSPKGQDSNQPTQLLPVRSYPPYSPPHLSPDMPVLRNLPVRRRLETESRMAAQLGEQQQQMGRGRGSSQPRKMDTPPGKDTSSSTDSNVNSPVAPVKRKRGRPPKNPPALTQSDKTVAPPAQPPKPGEEISPTQPPKRKRGRPRSTPLPENVLSASKVHPSTAQTMPTPHKPETPGGPTVTTSAEAKEADAKTEISAPSPNPAQAIITSDQTSTAVPVLSQDALQPDDNSSIAAKPTIPVPATDQSHSSTSVVPSDVPALLPATPTPGVSKPSSPPVEQAPIVSQTVKTGPESIQTVTDATPAPPTTASVSPSKTQTSITVPDVLPSASTTDASLPQPSARTSAPGESSDKAPSTAKCHPSPASATLFCPSAETQMCCATDMRTGSASLEQVSISAPAAVPQTAQASSLPPASTQATLTCGPAAAGASQPPSTSCPTVSDSSTASTSSAAMVTSPSSPMEASPKVSTEVVSATLVEIAAEAPEESVSVTGTPPSVTPMNRMETVTVTTSPAPETQASSREAPEHYTTSATPSTDVGEAVTVLQSASTSEPVAGASSPERSVRGTDVVTSTQLPTVSAPSTVPQGLSASSVCPEESTPSLMDGLHRGCSVSAEEEEALELHPDRETEMEGGAEETKAQTCEDDDKSKPQSKRRRVGSSSESKEPEKEDVQCLAASQTEPKQMFVEQSEDQKHPIQKRPLSRQSSQESARSSSPSSGCSTSTLTRQAHHKKTYEHRLPSKKRRVDVTSEKATDEDREERAEGAEGGSQKECCAAASRRRCSRSSSSSSDSDDGEGRKEHRSTRSSKHRQQPQETEKGSGHQGKKRTHSSEMNASNNTSTAGESGSDTSSARITRKFAGSQVSQGGKASANSAPSLPPEPEVLGKRCSALNAAAKLQAMKGRVDTPGHTPRKDPGAKAAGTSPGSSSDRNQKAKSKSTPATPQTNALNNNKSNGSKPSAPNQTSRSASRSTRQCPGSLVPPMDLEYKRSKPEEKERRGRKSFGGKEGEAETHSSSRGHSACSSMSSDGEGDGGRSSRSRSSSNSSQRTHSISSQNTEHRESRAASSGSERSSEQTRMGRRRASRWSHRLSQEASSSSGAEGTPDRVLRSVAALAAVHARSPAESTRSSSGQHRLNKT